MATTLAEYSKLSNDVLQKGIIETIVYESPILEKLPFIEIDGNALTYNRENGAAGADFYSPGDSWNEGTPTFSQATSTLTILGGDADIDEFIKKTRSNIQDIESATLELKLKAIAHKFDDTFINGSTTTDPKSFQGILNLVSSSTPDMLQDAGADGAALTLAMLDELCDAIKPGRPDALIMSKRSRRKILALLRASGSGIQETSRDNFGRPVDYYSGVPILIDEWQSDTETQGGSGAVCSSIYAVRFGEDGLCGLTNGWIEKERIGKLESKDASRWRIKWYCGLALFNELALARLRGINAT